MVIKAALQRSPNAALTVTDPILGLIKQCPRCPVGEDWWPLDAEFFYPDKNRATGFHPYCRACNLEGKELQRRAEGVKPMSQGGRHGRYCPRMQVCVASQRVAYMPSVLRNGEGELGQ